MRFSLRFFLFTVASLAARLVFGPLDLCGPAVAAHAQPSSVRARN
jgi:hypothetical protein